jgi:Arc/MetJ family transcription regulator
MPNVYKIFSGYTSERGMRTNIELDDELIAEAMAATGLPTKKATVEEALRNLVRKHRQKNAITNLAGLGWDGDLDASRQGRLDNHH